MLVNCRMTVRDAVGISKGSVRIIWKDILGLELLREREHQDRIRLIWYRVISGYFRNSKIRAWEAAIPTDGLTNLNCDV